MQTCQVDIRSTLALDNSTLTVETNVEKNGILSAGLQVPVRIGGQVGFVQVWLVEDVWHRKGVGSTITAGVIGVMLVEEEEDRLPCHGRCLSVTIPADLSGREGWELMAFQRGEGVACLRWQSHEWSSDGCTTFANYHDTSMDGNHTVRCECNVRDGLFRVRFDPPMPVYRHLPFLRPQHRVLKHRGFTVSAAIGGLFSLILTLCLTLLIPWFYQRKWFPYFGLEEGCPDLYTSEEVAWNDFDAQILAGSDASVARLEVEDKCHAVHQEIRSMSIIESELGIAKASKLRTYVSGADRQSNRA
eukprot:1061812-Rhodomonas_salina.1